MMQTEEFHELTTRLIATIGLAYEDLVVAYDPDDIIGLAEELVDAVRQHIDELTHETEFPVSSALLDGGQKFDE